MKLENLLFLDDSFGESALFIYFFFFVPFAQIE